MGKETEIKLPVRDMKAFERRVRKLGGKPVKAGNPRIHELNLIFDTPDGGLAKHGQLLRIRTETPVPNGTVAAALRRHASSQRSAKKNPPPPVHPPFKSPPNQPASGNLTHPRGGRHKVREEIEVVLTDAASL